MTIRCRLRCYKHTTMKFYTFKIVIEPEEQKNGGYYAYSPDLPGCYSNGASVEQTRENMKEAIEQHLEVLLEQKRKIPYLQSLNFKTQRRESSNCANTHW